METGNLVKEGPLNNKIGRPKKGLISNWFKVNEEKGILIKNEDEVRA